MPLFNSPMLLGFDQLERLLETAGKSSDGYPPYNIEQSSPDELRISLAVAGFETDMLEVTQDRNQLTIRGRQSDEKSDVQEYLHRGIAARQFQKKFILADGTEIKEAFLENGLLHIDLELPKPESEVRTIPIGKR